MFSRDFHKKTDDNEPWRWKTRQPCTVVSLFEEGCIEKGLSYLEGGPVYNLKAPHIGGLADTVNSLYAIKKLVFDLKKVSLNRFMTILRNNWEGEEGLRQFALNGLEYFGNDNDEVDEIAARLLSDFSDICASLEGTCGYHLPAGVSTFGRQLEWSPHRFATPYGKKAGDILSGNFSPTPGTDNEGATAIIKSYCKADLKRTVSGAALDIKLLPSSVDGENGIDGITPKLRINAETNEWEVSYDNGATWTSMGVKATGEQGEQGEKGDKGDKGEAGENGADASEWLVIFAIVLGAVSLAGNVAVIVIFFKKKVC
jgi:hypothetical protein